MSNPEFALAESVSTINSSYFILIYLLILIYCCFGLAIVCDAYFVPALQKLSITYDLSPDIAGSTLMALGASVPELFASLIGVFVTEDDIGTGSIIGSSCFNLIAVPAACAFVASATFTRKLVISPVPVMRNSAFYAITILVLLLIIKDNKVDIPEGLILLLFFVMYMAFMIFCAQSNRSSSQESHQSSLTNSYISTDSAIAECASAKKGNYLDANFGGINHHHHRQQQQQQQQNQVVYGHYYLTNATKSANYLSHLGNNQHGNNNNTKHVVTSERTPLVVSSQNKSCEVAYTDCNNLDQSNKEHTAPYHHHHQFMSQPNLLDSVSIDLGIAIKNSTCLMKNLDQDELNARNYEEHNWLSSKWVLLPMFPLTLSMKVLTPLKFKNTCWTIWTFIVSICLIGALTYVSVWVVHLLGQQLGIPETVAGMTILSWGTGIPELIASIVLIKKTAQADMAICNTIGSNVIDASFCLSLPWIVKCLLNKAAGLDPEVRIQSAALPWTSFTLLLSVVLLLLILKFHNWELSCSVGVWLTMTYVAFVGVATYLESSFSVSGLDLFSLM
uniref:Sodium/potassium/calcium exchanger 4 n=2 Tax=Aceria tosichella TaxID=561515 RepID=A0A6G1S2Y4_9ACAR